MTLKSSVPTNTFWGAIEDHIVLTVDTSRVSRFDVGEMYKEANPRWKEGASPPSGLSDSWCNFAKLRHVHFLFPLISSLSSPSEIVAIYPWKCPVITQVHHPSPKLTGLWNRTFGAACSKTSSMERQNPNQKGANGSCFGGPKKSLANSLARKKGLLRKGCRSLEWKPDLGSDSRSEYLRSEIQSSDSFLIGVLNDS